MPARESEFSYGQVESRKLHANPVEFTNYMSPYSVGREYRYHFLTQRRIQTVYPGYQGCYSLGFFKGIRKGIRKTVRYAYRP